MRYNKSAILVLLATFAILSAYYVMAASTNHPEPPEALSILNTGRFTDYNSTQAIQAEAGNVTELWINVTRSTQAWQGYYGNITGTITLDDASNYTLYSWSTATPTGEIYATNATSPLNWGTVRCVNFSAPISSNNTMNLSTLEDDFSINATDRDGFYETFYQTYSCGGGGEAPCIKVGIVTIPDDACHMATTYIDEQPQTTYFKELLLHDNSTSTLIFAAIIENDVDNFKPGDFRSDFQMLVAEDGHPGFEDTTTTYYFYIELA